MNEDVCDFVLQFLDHGACSWERAIPASLAIYEGDLTRKRVCHTRRAAYHDHTRGNFETAQIRLAA